MKKPKFKVGDRVEVVGKSRPILTGVIGFVVGVDGEDVDVELFLSTKSPQR